MREEEWFYKLLCAVTDPAMVSYVYKVASFTCPEKCYFISMDDADIGVFGRMYLNLPTLAGGQIGALPPLITLDAGESLSFCDSLQFGASYVKHSDVEAITDARQTWFRRLQYITQAIPARYKIEHTSPNESLRTAIKVTNKAIITTVSLRAITAAFLDGHDGTGYHVIGNFFSGMCSGKNHTHDYVYHTMKVLFPLRAIPGHIWYMRTASADWCNANFCNAYFEVLDDLPSPPW